MSKLVNPNISAFTPFMCGRRNFLLPKLCGTRPNIEKLFLTIPQQFSRKIKLYHLVIKSCLNIWSVELRFAVAVLFGKMMAIKYRGKPSELSCSSVFGVRWNNLISPFNVHRSVIVVDRAQIACLCATLDFCRLVRLWLFFWIYLINCSSLFKTIYDATCGATFALIWLLLRTNIVC